MSIKDLADQLAAKGRYGDSELVHMTKGEVAGLQNLAQAAGGSLTINPETGKPEAFFLAALLPTVLGAAAPALGAAATGAGLTGLGGLLSGKFGAMGLGALAGGLMNRDNPLMGAVTGGLGGMGGGQLAGALTGSGAAGAQQAAMSGLTDTGARNLAAAQATNQFTAQPLMSQMGQGVSALGSEAGRTAAMQGLGGVGGAMRTGMMAAAPAMGAMMSQRPMEMPEETGSIPEYDFAYNPTGYTTRGSEELMQFRPTFTRRAAQGGIMSLAMGGMAEGGFVVPADVVALLGEGNTEAGYATLEDMFPEAVAIRGQDGGQADTVETTIEGEQPAAVAHGEVYLPPEAVERAGGAKKLYAMMENVRKQAMGTDRQIRPVDPDKVFA